MTRTVPRLLEVLIILGLVWFFLSWKFILGFAAGAIVAGEIWASMRGRSE